EQLTENPAEPRGDQRVLRPRQGSLQRLVRFAIATPHEVEVTERGADARARFTLVRFCETERQAQVADVRFEAIEPGHGIPPPEVWQRLRSEAAEERDQTGLQLFELRLAEPGAGELTDRLEHPVPRTVADRGHSHEILGDERADRFDVGPDDLLGSVEAGSSDEDGHASKDPLLLR